MKIESTETGLLELQVSKDPDDFKRLAERVRVSLDGKGSQQVDHHDQSYWDLECGGTKFTIHREHYLGEFVSCADTPANRELPEELICDLDTMSA